MLALKGFLLHKHVLFLKNKLFRLTLIVLPFCQGFKIKKKKDTNCCKNLAVTWLL